MPNTLPIVDARIPLATLVARCHGRPIPAMLLPPTYRRAVVIGDLHIDLGQGQSGVVPAGFVTDFSSTPRFLWRVFPPWDDYMPAAIWHDWRYWRGECDQATADGEMLAAGLALKVSACKMRVLHAGLRVGGWHAWGQHRRGETFGQMVALPPDPLQLLNFHADQVVQNLADHAHP